MTGRYGTVVSHDNQNWIVEVRGTQGWLTMSTRPLTSQRAAFDHAAHIVRPNYPGAMLRVRPDFAEDAKPRGTAREKFFVRWLEDGREVKRAPTDYETASRQYSQKRRLHEGVELVAQAVAGERIIARGGTPRSAKPANVFTPGREGAQAVFTPREKKDLSPVPKGRVQKIRKNPGLTHDDTDYFVRWNTGVGWKKTKVLGWGDAVEEFQQKKRTFPQAEMVQLTPDHEDNERVIAKGGTRG